VNDVDDLDGLERELGPGLRVALGRAAAEISDDGRTTSPWASLDARDGVAIVDLESSSQATTGRERRRRRPVIAWIVSAAVAVVVVALAVVVLSRLDAGKPADEPIEAVADSFMTAWVRGDGEGVAALMSADGSVGVWSAEMLPALHDWFRAVGAQYHDDGCEVTSPATVSCRYSLQNDLTRAVGVAPVAGTFVLVVDDGVVASVADRIDTATYHDIWAAFVQWVRTKHPADLDRMFASDASYPLVDQVSIGLWAGYVAQFSGSDAAYIARADAICTAAHNSFQDLVAASPENGTVSTDAAARIVEEALATLRAVPPPKDAQARFDVGYALLEQLVDAFRQLAANRPAPATGPDSTPSPPSPGDLANLLHQIDYLQIGLTGCAVNASR
jgi:hypothetical protein